MQLYAAVNYTLQTALDPYIVWIYLSQQLFEPSGQTLIASQQI